VIGGGIDLTPVTVMVTAGIVCLHALNLGLPIPIVVLLALVDGDVVHPHRVFLGHRRGVGETHRVAVIDNLPAGLHLGCRFGVDADILAGEDNHVRLSVVSPPRRQRIERPAVGVLVIDDGTGRLRHPG